MIPVNNTQRSMLHLLWSQIRVKEDRQCWQVVLEAGMVAKTPAQRGVENRRCRYGTAGSRAGSR